MNKLKAIALLVTLSSLLLSPLSGQTPAWPHEQSDLPVDSSAKWGRLDNGLRYVILPWSEPAGRLSLRLVVEAGSLHEKESQRGLAHFLEHMAFNGTKNFTSGEMVEYFQRLGMDFGADTNAHTWWRETVYKLELPRIDDKLLRDSLLLMRDYADGMLLGNEEIEKERGIIMSEKRDSLSPQRRAYEAQLKFNFPDSLLSERIPIGTDAVIQHAPREAFVDFYQTWYTSDRMILVIVGDSDEATLLPLIDEYFGSMETVKERRPDPVTGNVPPRDLATRFYDDPELPQTEIELYAMQNTQREPDTYSKRVYKLARDLANQMISLRLERRSREENAPFLQAQAYGYEWLDFVRMNGIYATAQPENWQDALAVLDEEIRRALDYGFSPEELEEAKARVRNVIEQSATQAPTRKSRDISSEIARSLIDGYVFMHPEQVREVMLPALDSLDVETVSAVLMESWSAENLSIYVSGNLHRIIDQSYTAMREREVDPPQAFETVNFAYTDFGPAGEIRETRNIEDLGITQYIFDNGVRLSVKATDFESNTIRIAIRLGSGKLNMPEDHPGIALTTENIFIEGGLGEHSMDDLRRILAGRTVETGFSVEDDAFHLSGRTNREDLLLQLQLLAAYVQDPGYRPEAERVARRALDSLYNTLRHNPRAVMANEVSRFLASGDPRFGYPTREQAEEVTTEHVRTWLQDALQNEYLEIAIVGDIQDINSARDAVAKTFGALKQREESVPDFSHRRKVSFPREAGPQTFNFVSDLPQAWVTVQWPTVGLGDIFEVRRFNLLGSIFSDRLRKIIREEIGEAYSPYAYNISSDVYKGYGYMRAVVGVNPGQTEQIIGVLKEIGDDLADDGIDEDEMVRAIEPLKTSLEEQLRNNNYWLSRVLLGSHIKPEQLEYARSLPTYYPTIRQSEIEQLAEQYLKSEDAVPAVVIPVNIAN